MRSTFRLLLVLAALLLVPGLAAAADQPAPAPAPSTPELFFAAPDTAELMTSADAPALGQLLSLPEPTRMACTFTDFCSNCSGGLKFCRRTCCNGSCSTSCGVCGGC